MKKNLLIIIIFYFVLVISSYGAGFSDGDDNKSSLYNKGVSLIKKAKKLEKKGKIEKAKKRFNKALEYLITANEKNPEQADTLNYLGFTTRKLGNFEQGEKYYLQGLDINPNHIGINEYLGELYVVTNRLDLAKDRLKVLEGCNCEEFNELKAVIDGSKKSKY